MTTGLGMLKHFPCPAGASCTAFKCLFKHPGEEDPDESQAEPAQIPVDGKATGHDLEAPRKRIKLTTASSTTSSTNLKASSLQAKSTDFTVRNGISEAGKQSKLATQVATTPLAKASSSKQSSSAPVAVKTAPKKPETLNPRLVPKAPAQHDFRHKLVKLLHEQYARLNTELKKAAKMEEASLVMTDQELIIKALDDEEDIARKKASVYGNAVKNLIMTYKRMKLPQWSEERLAAVKKAKGEDLDSKEQSASIETGLTLDQEVQYLHRLATDLGGLQRYGYITTIPSEEEIEKAKNGVEASGHYEICDRCTRRFAVFPGRREEDGALTTNGPCTYHPGKVYTVDRPPGDRSTPLVKKYRCCHQKVGDTDGCTTSEHHVFKVLDPARLAGVLNFAETPDNSAVPADRAVCFDCEMGYTVYGMELIRVTAVSWPDGGELLDVLVYPQGEYLDLNTRYSGVRPGDFVEAKRWKPGDDPSPTTMPSADPSKPPQRKLKLVPSPAAARDLFFSIISPDTPLIGHGTENDLNALRIIHPVVVDTVILYPHKRGLPMRNGLKYLMQRELNREIQTDEKDEEDNPLGHDSGEDARAAGDLVRLKIKEEWEKLKGKGWTADDQGLHPPGEDGWTLVTYTKAE